MARTSHQALRSGVASILIASLGLLAPACGDANVGRLFDRNYGKGGGGASSSIQAPLETAIVLPNRPLVQRVGPTGGGAQPTTPIFVLFNEAMNLDSIKSSTGEDPTHLYLRRKVESGSTGGGGNQALPASYNLLLGGRLVVIRPTAALPSDMSYEVVVGKDVRDIDRQTVQKQGVIAEFKTDSPVSSGPKVVFEYPRLNDKGVIRESPVVIGFSQPVDPTTVTSATFFMKKTSDQSAVTGLIDYPLAVGQAPDPRTIIFDPDPTLDATASYDFTYTDGIKTGTIKLAVGNKVPPVQFETMAPQSALGIQVGNPSVINGVTFANKVNTQNLANLGLEVDLPAGTLIGDKVLLRIYGKDALVTASDVLLYSENIGTVTVAGAHQEVFAVPGALGTLTEKLFKEGSLTLAVAIQRGSTQTGMVLAQSVTQDTVLPTVTNIGPPLAVGTSNVFLTDLNAAALHGVASEPLGSLELTVASQTYGLFASAKDGRFFSQPFFLGRNGSDLAFALNVIDAAGNRSQNSFNGFFRQRGFLTGSVSGGSLRVVAYDESTLQPVSGATVLIEPGFPQKPSVGQSSATTLADGSAVFTGLSAGSYSITLVHGSYHLVSVLATGAAVASLPMRPLSQATTSVSGSLVFTAIPGITAKAGLNILDDDSGDGGVFTSSTDATKLGTTPVRPNRPMLATAYAGILPPTGNPSYLFTSTELAATSGGVGSNLPPQVVKGAGDAYTVILPMVAGSGITGKPLNSYNVDLTQAVGLNASNLDGDVQVHMMASFGGFAGTSLMGLGFAAGTGTTRIIDGSYNVGTLLNFAALGPLLWSSVQAKDLEGNISRCRSVYTDTVLGLVLVLGDLPAIPVLDTPTGPFTGSPAVTFADRLDTSILANTVAPRRIRVLDGQDRRWDLYSFDQDGTSAVTKDTVQLPVLPGTVTGLANGTWNISVEDWLLLAPGTNSSEINFEDYSRLQVRWARSKVVAHTIQ